MTTTMTRRQFLALIATACFAIAATSLARDSGDAATTHSPPRFFFTSQGKTARMNADGTDLHWFDFKIPNQTGWAPFGFFRDGHRVLFFSMDPRRDGPGRPFDDYYHQTPTHIWVHDLDNGELTEIATRDRIAPYYGGGVLINDKSILMQVVRSKNGAQIFNMNLDGSDAKEFTRDGEGFPYGLNASPDSKRVAFHLATPASYQVWVSDIDGSNRIRVAADPDHLYFAPVWSADGKWLIFHDCQYKQEPGHDWSDVYLCRPDGSDHRVLTKGGAVWLSASYGDAHNHTSGSESLYWTHDGKILCACRLPGSKVPWEFQAQRPDTNHFNRDFKPELARGGTEICNIDPRDGSVTRLTKPGEGVWDFRATESPDGRMIVFCRAKTGELPAIWMMNSDGTNQRELSKGLDNQGADYPRWTPQAKI
jgi:Tol biopolymer transport system component